MFIGEKRSPEKIIGLWVMTFGLYGIYWLSMTFSELQSNRKKGISGRSYALLAVLFPPLAVSACWLLPAYVGRLYAENGKLEHRSEEHTSEIQSPNHIVRRLLLEKNN